MELIQNESRQVYISRINMVQDYIQNHLEDELCIQQLAGVASFSEFHFQRIFRQVAGESLYSYIKRLRLEKAVFLLRNNKRLSIQDIALSVGFSNQASFAKALKEKYKVSASMIRKIDDIEMEGLVKENSTNGKVCEKGMHYNIPIELTIKAISPIRLLYIRNTGSYKGRSDLFVQLFTKLCRFASKRGYIDEETKWFVIYHDYGDLTEEDKLRLSVCMSIHDDAACEGEFGCMELEGGKYAVGKFFLKTNEYQGAWDYMISKWLPESGYMPDDRVCFEYYPPQEYKNDSEGRIVEISIPITPL